MIDSINYSHFIRLEFYFLLYYLISSIASFRIKIKKMFIFIKITVHVLKIFLLTFELDRENCIKL